MIHEDDMADAMTRPQAAKFLKMSVTTLDRLVAGQAIEVVRPSGKPLGRVYITKRAALDYLNGQRTPRRTG